MNNKKGVVLDLIPPNTREFEWIHIIFLFLSCCIALDILISYNLRLFANFFSKTMLFNLLWSTSSLSLRIYIVTIALGSLKIIASLSLSL